MGKRRQAREMAVQMLYQHDLGGSSLEEVFHSFEHAQSSPLGEAWPYARTLVYGAVENRPRVDGLVEAGATNWRMARLSAVDRSILRVAVYELLFETDVPQIVVVDEAIELAKRFGSEQSAAFVNGVLDGLLRTGDFPVQSVSSTRS